MLLIGPKGKLEKSCKHHFSLPEVRFRLPKSSEFLEPVMPILRHKDVCDHLLESCSILYSVGIVIESGVLGDVSVSKYMSGKT